MTRSVRTVIPSHVLVLTFNQVLLPHTTGSLTKPKTNDGFNLSGTFEWSVQREWTETELRKTASLPSKAEQAKSGTEIKRCHSEI